jgi:hypothetical protein
MKCNLLDNDDDDDVYDDYDAVHGDDHDDYGVAHGDDDDDAVHGDDHDVYDDDHDVVHDYDDDHGYILKCRRFRRFIRQASSNGNIRSINTCDSTFILGL